jgi:hypothetical protein
MTIIKIAIIYYHSLTSTKIIEKILLNIEYMLKFINIYNYYYSYNHIEKQLKQR